MTIEAGEDEREPVPTIPVICDACKAQGSAGQEGFSGIADILNFEPVPRRTQVNNWTPELQRAFIAALAITGSPSRAGKAIGRHEHGAEKLREARGGRSFARAWDAALGIYRDRELARLGDQMSELSNASLDQVQNMDENSGDGDGDEEPGYAEYQAAQERIRDRLLRARRLYLRAICADEESRAAWETLCGPVDWDKAMALQPQDNEPYQPRMVKPDMLLSAEGGCMPDVVGRGRDRLTEFKEACEEADEALKRGDLDEGKEDYVDGPKVRRFFSRDGNDGEGQPKDDGGKEREEGEGEK